ncbi:MAG: hypothetical protein JXA13_06140 [Anaerolineales bacterium]|nr:hypothetical protein [Anaerolineales bacterium]
MVLFFLWDIQVFTLGCLHSIHNQGATRRQPAGFLLELCSNLALADNIFAPGSRLSLDADQPIHPK